MCILLLMGTLEIMSMRGETQTIDEGVHLTAGVSYLLKWDFRMNEEHPPLIKDLAGLSVLLVHPHILFDTPAWREGNEWAFAHDFLYLSGNNADRILFAARIPMVLVSLALACMIYLWGRRIGGDLVGLLAAGWYAFDPNFLAHGRYVTTDVGVALGYAVALYVLVRLLEKWTWKRIVAFGITFALAQMTKFSAVFLWILIIVIPILWYFIYPIEGQTLKKIIKRVLTIFASALAGFIVVTFIIYGGQVAYGRDDIRLQQLMVQRSIIVSDGTLDQQRPEVQKVIHLTDPQTATGRFINRIVFDTPVPAWSYFKGLSKLISHDIGGHLAYLLGRYSYVGWWWYFPVAFLVKTPLVTIVFLLAALFVTMSRQRKEFFITRTPGLWVLLISALLYFLWSLTSKINLGVRHIFPVYPALFVLIGCFAAGLWEKSSKTFRAVLVILVAGYMATSLAAYPAYTAYFSEAIGGSNNGPKYLVDSNIDWGQDVKRLKTYLLQNNIPHVCMSYFGQADLPYYGIDYRYLPTSKDPHTPGDVNCVVAISVTSLLSQDQVYWWLKDYTPDARIGGSIYIYDFRGGRTPAINTK